MEVGTRPISLLELLSVNAGENSEAEGSITHMGSPCQGEILEPCLVLALKCFLFLVFGP